MSFFEAAYAIVVGEIEKGYSKDPRDPGNWTSGKVGQGVLKGTKGGIAASAYPQLDIENLTPEQIQSLYHQDYWYRSGCDMPGLTWEWCLCLFDCAVNQGVGTADTLSKLAHRDALELMTLRALHYAASATEHTFGHSWFHRLFLIMKAAQTAPSLPPIT
jgi:lysozyme family protein